MSKKYFEAIGRQAQSLGIPWPWPAHYYRLDRWVKHSIAAGYSAQMPRRPAIERIKSRMAAESLQPKGQLMRIGGGL